MSELKILILSYWVFRRNALADLACRLETLVWLRSQTESPGWRNG
jgi:hypothetical protein